MARSEIHKGFQILYGDESNKTFGIAVGNGSRALHVFEATDAATDWNVAADTHPSLYIHSATTPATDYIKLYHDATDAYINGVGATAMNFQIAGTTEMSLAAAALTLSAPLTIGVDDTGYDVTFFGATASSKLLWDESDDRLELDGADINLQDSDILQFGDAQDVAVTWNATNLVITPAVDDTGAIYFGNGTLDMDVRFTLGAAADYVEFDVGNKALEFVGLAKIDIGSSGTALVLTQGTPIFEFYATCADTSGSSIEGFYVQHTLTGAAGTGGRARFYMTTNVGLGGWSNALKAEVVYGASGSTSGMGSAFVAELALSAGTTAGTYAPLESEIISNTSCSTGTATSFLYANIAGTDTSVANTSGYLFELGSGVVDTSSGLFDVNAASPTTVTFDANLKIRIGGVDYYIPLGADNAFE